MIFLFCFGTGTCVPIYLHVLYSDFGSDFLPKRSFSFALVPEYNVPIFILAVVEMTEIRNKTNDVNKRLLVKIRNYIMFTRCFTNEFLQMTQLQFSRTK